MVAAASGVIVMPLEDWVRHSRHDMFLYDWQTLIAGVLALLAGFGTIWVTRHIANRQIAETRKQTETTVRLERERVASEASAFRALLEAAMTRVRAEAERARENNSDAFAPTTEEVSVDAYAVRQCITKGAFAELRGACVRRGSPLTHDFLDLEGEIDNFALQVGTYALGAARIPVLKGKLADLSKQLDEIKRKADALREQATERI